MNTPSLTQPSTPFGGAFHNVHATGWCSSAHAGRQAAIASAERGKHWRPEGHPQGPVVARVRVKRHPMVQAILPATYVDDAIERLALKPHECFVLETREGAPWRYNVYLTPKRLAAVIQDARFRAEGAASRQHRASSRRALQRLEAVEERIFPN